MCNLFTKDAECEIYTQRLQTLLNKNECLCSQARISSYFGNEPSVMTLKVDEDAWICENAGK